MHDSSSKGLPTEPTVQNPARPRPKSFMRTQPGPDQANPEYRNIPKSWDQATECIQDAAKFA